MIRQQLHVARTDLLLLAFPGVRHRQQPMLSLPCQQLPLFNRQACKTETTLMLKYITVIAQHAAPTNTSAQSFSMHRHRCLIQF